MNVRKVSAYVTLHAGVGHKRIIACGWCKSVKANVWQDQGR